MSLARLPPKHRFAVSLLASLAALSPATVLAEEPTAEASAAAASAPGDADPASGELTAAAKRANELFAQGSGAVRRGDFEEARRLYREVWTIQKTADVATNLGLVELELKNHAAAARLFAHALRQPLPSTKPEQHRVAEQGLEEARRHVATLTLSVTPADARLIVEGEPIPEKDRAELFVTPGRHEITATTARASAVASVEVARGESRRVELTVNQEAEAPPPAARREVRASEPAPIPPPSYDSGQQRTSLRPVVLVLEGALALGLAGAGTAFAVYSYEEDREAKRLKKDSVRDFREGACLSASPPEICESISKKIKSSERARTAAIALFAGSGVMAAAFVVTALAWKRPRRGRASFELAPEPVAGGSLITLRGSF